MQRFTDQVVLITGAGSGIGRGTALAFARGGATVVVSDISEESGQETVSLIENDGGQGTFIHCDVANTEQISDLVQLTVEKYGRLDVAINNAGIGGNIAKLAEVPAAEYEKVMAVNLGGVFFGMQHQIRQMLTQKSGGRIVNVASVAGLRAMPGNSVYTATKHAVVGLTKATAMEYARHKIRINAVCPAFTHSAMVDKLFALAPDYEQKLLKNIPLGRYGEPEDIAQAILWLCDPANSFVTGHALPLDGGMMAM
ncbi:SDR family NAD(P)-dependent oxidoreductase [Persicitalea jodogahamensis]|uniref:Short chain dehydrogenase n=1 Tax=Persicitalea jodogahamensis TaxID=402147 RepID=A0A8J3D6V6_9BACT|nr:glucose 1-dehydrogenase [Persicitalea jodogahamensis]GHB69378.1 short chain dehydrogenase [Persicitalea jodogahamensis]